MTTPLANSFAQVQQASRNTKSGLREYLDKEVEEILESRGQKAIPYLAKQKEYVNRIEKTLVGLSCHQVAAVHDSRSLSGIPDESVHLVVTSPPYWCLKEYTENPKQLGSITDYEEFIQNIDKVWREVYRVLIPGGRLVVIVGDVCLSRRKHGRHEVVPLHSTIQVNCREIGYENLAPIFWYKISNAAREASGSGSFLGKPYEPNAVIKHDMEYILSLRKGGGYRSPSLPERAVSLVSAESYQEWFQQIWKLKGASTKEHPAPFPETVAKRVVSMFSFVGDIVLDPFMGTGTTLRACKQLGRHGIGLDIESGYVDLAKRKLSSTGAEKRLL